VEKLIKIKKIKQLNVNFYRLAVTYTIGSSIMVVADCAALTLDDLRDGIIGAELAVDSSVADTDWQQGI